MNSLFVAALLVWPAISGAFIEHAPLRVNEDGIRRSASKTTMPVYPADSKAHRIQGVVVVDLEYDGDGNVVWVNVIESPDQSTGKAAIDAVRNWKFLRTTVRGQPVHVKGKLTFYFRIDRNGIGRVENPKQFK